MRRAVGDLQADVERVSGVKPAVAAAGGATAPFAVIVGTVGKSPLVDGLAKAVKGSSTEYTSAVDLSAITQASALAFATEMDTLLSSLMRTPDVLLVSPAMHVKINAIMRVLGIGKRTGSLGGSTAAPVRSYSYRPDSYH